MVLHYPNLVCWHEVFCSVRAKQDVVNIDSISAAFLAKILGMEVVVRPGLEEATRLRNANLPIYFLLPHAVSSIDSERALVLRPAASVDGDVEVRQFISGLPAEATVVVGISSPKQNRLAVNLSSQRPDLTFYCLGAAVDAAWGGSAESLRSKFPSHSSWLFFLIRDPARTSRKIWQTVSGFLRVICSEKLRSEYRALCIQSNGKFTEG